MTVRKGRLRVLRPEDYEPVDLGFVNDLALQPGESMIDVTTRLDPDRLAAILGVTEGGALGAADVPSFGEKLLTNGLLGVDLIVVPPGAGFPPHVHPGHHLLLCLKGRGTFTLDQQVHEVRPGFLSMVEAAVPHAVGNPYDQPHVLLAFGSPHKELDAEDRMVPVDWDGRTVLAPQAEGAASRM